MQELMQSTSRIRRGWLDRLRGYKRVFETEITDGEHNAYGRGPTAEASQKSAQRIWDAEFWEATPELTLRSQVHTPCRSGSSVVAGDSLPSRRLAEIRPIPWRLARGRSAPSR